MIMLEVGKLYVCEEYHLMLYPDPDTAADGASAVAAQDREQVSSYTEKNIPLLVLNSKDKCVEVLAGDKKGWIVCRHWLKIKEIDYV